MLKALLIFGGFCIHDPLQTGTKGPFYSGPCCTHGTAGGLNSVQTLDMTEGGSVPNGLREITALTIPE